MEFDSITLACAFLVALFGVVIIIAFLAPMVPGKPNIIVMLLPSTKGQSAPHPTRAIHSLLSHISGRLAWNHLAKSRGTTPHGLVDQIKNVTDFSWTGSNQPVEGTIVEAWDRLVVWDNDCLNFLLLESWRDRSDQIADEVFSTMDDTVDDPLATVYKSIENDEKNSLHDLFWKDVDRRPPRGCGAVSIDWFRDHDAMTPAGLVNEAYLPTGMIDFDAPDPFTDDYKASQEELQEESRALNNGKRVFYRYFPVMLLSLLHAGLTGGFASPRIMSVLRATGYLVEPSKEKKAIIRLDEVLKGAAIMNAEDAFIVEKPSSKSLDRTFTRLLETLQFILDVMETETSMIPPSQTDSTKGDSLSRAGAGWKSATRVRFIHSSVRRRITRGDPNPVEVPINQEDLLFTLCSFCIAPLCSLQRLGLEPSHQERQDFVNLWRHVGYYLGIEPRLLRRCFRDVDSAERYFFCVASHLFLGIPVPKSRPKPFRKDMNQENFKGPAMSLLACAANRPPVAVSFGTNCAIARHFLGDSWADCLLIPTMTTWQYIKVRLLLLILVTPCHFTGYYWRAGWKGQVVNYLRLTLRSLLQTNIAKQLGKSGGFQSSFQTRNHDKKDFSSLVMNPTQGRSLRLKLIRLVVEATISSFAATFASLAVVYCLYRFLSVVRVEITLK